MESLNLKNLANSLPTSNLANAETDLLNDFKGTFFWHDVAEQLSVGHR